MKRNKIIICIVTVALLATAIFGAVVQRERVEIIPFSLTVDVNGETEQIKCWESEDNGWYVFLPSFLKLSQAKIALNTANKVWVDGTELYDGMTCDIFSANEVYDFEYNSFGRKIDEKITFVQSADIASMYISTESGTTDYIHADKENEENAALRIYDAKGNLNFKGNLAKIGGRGNSTWERSDKKPYNITLLNDADILSMGADREWVLLANALDESNLRNKLVYDFSRLVGVTAPECEYVDLYLNGEYAGLYLLCERNEIGEARLDISSDNSFLVSLESQNKLISEKRPYISTQNGQALRIHSSSLDNDALTRKWQSVENAILAENGIDTVTGKHWRDLIDADSWARKYLVEEIFGNFDACFTSQYFYCDESLSDKIFAGPVWDFDLSIGLDAIPQISGYNILVANRKNVGNGYETPWFYSLYNNDEFKKLINDLYKREFQSKLKEYMQSNFVDCVKCIENAATINAVRWNCEKNSEQGAEISSFIENRLNFLNNIWINGLDYHTVQFISGTTDYDGYYIAYNGKALERVPKPSDNKHQSFIGWYYAETDEPFDTEKPIYEDTVVYAKWQNNDANSFEKLLKLVPIAVIAVIFIALLVVEINRIKKRGDGIWRR